MYELQNKVLWLDISVNIAEIMHHLKAISCLPDYSGGLFFRESMMNFKQGIDLWSCGELREDIEMIVIMKIAIERDDIDMS